MTADQRRLLELLAASADDGTDALLREHGLALEVMAGLVRVGLVHVHCDRAVDITRVWITDAGRRALAQSPSSGSACFTYVGQGPLKFPPASRQVSAPQDAIL